MDISCAETRHVTYTSSKLVKGLFDIFKMAADAILDWWAYFAMAREFGYFARLPLKTYLRPRSVLFMHFDPQSKA